MICPYCSEKIADTAIVCPTCRRDLAFFKPVLDNVRKIEHDISALTSAIKELREWSEDSAQEFIAAAHIAPTIAIVASALLATTFHWLAWQDFAVNPIDRCLLFLSLTSPFIAGFGLGWLGRKTRFGLRALLGMVCGILGGAQYLLVVSLERAQLALNNEIHGAITLYPPNTGTMILFFLISGILTFPSGGQFGAILRNRRKLSKQLTELPRSSREQSTQWKSTPTAASPYLTTVLTVVGAIICSLIAQFGPQFGQSTKNQN
ncbi:MAG: hypothetical protein WBE38_05410, partial [Terracidiphilus sp.]